MASALVQASLCLWSHYTEHLSLLALSLTLGVFRLQHRPPVLTESQAHLPATVSQVLSTQILSGNFMGREAQGGKCETKYHFANESEAVVCGSSHYVFIE